MKCIFQDTIRLKIRPTYEATTCPYNKGPLPVEYTTKYFNILRRKRSTQVDNYLKKRRIGRIYTRAVLVSKGDQDICIPASMIGHLVTAAKTTAQITEQERANKSYKKDGENVWQKRKKKGTQAKK